MFRRVESAPECSSIKDIVILTPGEMGTAIGQVLARTHRFNITLGFRSDQSYQHFLNTGESPRMPGIKLDKSIHGTTDLPSVLRTADLVILAVSTPHINDFFSQIKDEINPRAAVLSVIKGFDPKTGMRISEFLFSQDPTLRNRFAALSGPNLARPIAQGLPAATVIASENIKLAKKLTELFKGSNIRAYPSIDLIGTELGGALKNIIAFAGGMADGMGYGLNAIAALMTRGIGEIAGLTVLEGGSERTITMGNAGIGDLITSIIPPGGRNFQAGVRYGRFAIGAEGGQDLDTIINSGETLEGLIAAKVAGGLLDRNEAEYPVMGTAIKVINGELDPKEASHILMEREFTYEDPEPVVDRRVVRWLNWTLHIWNRRYFSPLRVVKSLWKKYHHSISARET